MGLYHGWDNDPDEHADFVRGGVSPDDFDKVVDYKPRRKKKGCKKGKGAPCAFTKEVVRGQWYNQYQEMWTINRVMVCERCGKHDWKTYRYEYRSNPIN